MYEFSLVATPANASYHAMNATTTPRTPPALVTPVFCVKLPIDNSKNVIVNKKNSEKKATVDFMVQSVNPAVKIVHPSKKNPTAEWN